MTHCSVMNATAISTVHYPATAAARTRFSNMVLHGDSPQDKPPAATGGRGPFPSSWKCGSSFILPRLAHLGLVTAEPTENSRRGAYLDPVDSAIWGCKLTGNTGSPNPPILPMPAPRPLPSHCGTPRLPPRKAACDSQGKHRGTLAQLVSQFRDTGGAATTCV